MSISQFPAHRGALLEALAVLDDAVEGVAAVPLWQSADADLLAALIDLDRVQARVAAVRLGLLHQVETRQVAVTAGAPSTAAWLTGTLRVHPSQSRRQVRLAAGLPTTRRATGAALADGAISPDHAQVIVDGLAALPVTVPAADVEAAEATLLGEAAVRDPRQVAFLARHLRFVTDPDGASALAREEARLACRRELHVTPVEEGWVNLSGTLEAEAGALLIAALDPLAAPRPATADGPDLRTPARRRADALVDLIQIAVRSGQLPTQGGIRPTLVVTLDHTTLTDQTGKAGLLDTGQPLSPAALRRLACDAGVIPIVLGSASQPLDVGRASYTCPPAIRRDLVARDGGCAFPGCGRPARWTDAHHITHWADGGSTSLDNITLLCGHHHRTIHADTGWTIESRPGAPPVFHPPPWIPRR